MAGKGKTTDGFEGLKKLVGGMGEALANRFAKTDKTVAVAGEQAKAAQDAVNVLEKRVASIEAGPLIPGPVAQELVRDFAERIK